MIGIFGGSFNPPHIGHLILAEEARLELNLRKVIFVPSGISPHKREILDTEKRLKMVNLAVVSSDFFSVSDFEANKKTPGYTIETLEHFSKKFKSEEIVFLMGGDCLKEIKTWHRWKDLLENFKLAVFIRDGFNEDEIEGEILEKVQILKNPIINVSSSEIRNRIKKGRAYRYFVPERVYHYIEALGLYR